MRKLMKHLHKNEKGFTLVELMVVVVIIGVLVAIAIPVYNNVQGTAQQNACDATVRTLNGASSMYNANTGAFPTSVADLVNGGYILETPACPTTGEYQVTNGVFSCTVHGTN